MVVIRGDEHHKYSVSIFKSRYGANKVSKSTAWPQNLQVRLLFTARWANGAINPPRVAAVLAPKQTFTCINNQEYGERRRRRQSTQGWYLPSTMAGTTVCGYSVCSDLILNSIWAIVHRCWSLNGDLFIPRMAERFASNRDTAPSVMLTLITAPRG